MFYLLFTIILFVVAHFSKKEYEKNMANDRSRILAAFFFVFWFYYLIRYIELVNGVKVNEQYDLIVRIVMNLLVPLGYMYVCERCHIRLLSASTIGMFALIALNCFSSGSVYLDGVAVRNFDNSRGIHFYYGGRQVLMMQAYEIVQVIQSLWVVIRTFILFRIIKRRSLKLSTKAINVFITIGVILVALILSSLLSDEQLKGGLAQTAFFSVHLFLACFCLLFLGKGYMIALILDENKESAYMDTTPQFAALKTKLDMIMREEKLYLDKDLGVEKVAHRLNTNRTYLTKLMKTEYGATFTTYINTLRINEAKTMLRSKSKMKLEDVAFACGFASASSFSKIFRAIAGQSPREWKEG